MGSDGDFVRGEEKNLGQQLENPNDKLSLSISQINEIESDMKNEMKVLGYERKG